MMTDSPSGPDQELRAILDQVASMSVVELPMTGNSVMIIRFNEGRIEMTMIPDRENPGVSTATCRLEGRGALTVGAILSSFGQRWIDLDGATCERVLN